MIYRLIELGTLQPRSILFVLAFDLPVTQQSYSPLTLPADMSEYEEGSHAEESHGSHGHASHGHGHASHGKSGGGAVGILKAIHGATKKDAKPETHPTQTPLAPGQVPGQVPSQAPPPNSQQPILNGQPSLQPGYDPNHPQPVNGAPAHANDVPVTAEAKKEEKQDFMDKGTCSVHSSSKCPFNEI